MAERRFVPSVNNLLNFNDVHTPAHDPSAVRRQSSMARVSGSSGMVGRTAYRQPLPSAHVQKRAHNTPQQQPQLPSVREVLRNLSEKEEAAALARNSLPNSITNSMPKTRIDYNAVSYQDAGVAAKKGYPCERCGRIFTRKSDALKHIRVVHDRLKVFACSVCGRRFARKDYCTKHEKSLHNITPVPSPYQIRRQMAKEQASKSKLSGSGSK